MKKKIDRGEKPWTDIPWREGYYQINEDGQIRSFWKRCHWWSELSAEPQIYIQPWRKHMKRYWPSAEITLYNWLKRKHYYLARIMAMTYMWLDINDKTKNVIHKDSDWMNCRLSNLEITSASWRTIKYLNIKYKENKNVWLALESMKCWWYYETEKIKNIDMNSVSKDQLIEMIVHLMEECNLLLNN